MHTFKNFKNFADVEIDLSKPMTLLIGRNGSGKSNLIEGVALLAELIKGREVHEISDVNQGAAFQIRGNLQGCFQQHQEKFEIGFQDSIFFEQQQQQIDFQITATLKPAIQISKQALINGKNLLEKIQQKLPDNNSATIAGGAAGGIALASGLGLIPILGWVALAATVANQNNKKPIDKTQQDYQRLLIKYIETYSFNIYPPNIRQYSLIGQKKLTKNGSNLSSVLFYLEQEKPNILKRILERIRQLPEENITKFEFIKTTANDVIFGFKYKNNEIINAKLLSDGTLRTLAILTTLETVPEGSRLIIEEIDNGVHASRTKILIDAIWETSNRRKLNTLITTHNSATLDGLEEEQLECVVVCHYDKKSQSAKLTPFMELPHVDILLQKGKLGGLVTRNVIEHYLDPEFEQKRQAKMTNWLESIE
ncbi:MAG: AAA family ATPase [Methylococcales bacterium]|nr:AAA family ATPase [Methylococcales bacterium]